MIEGIGTDIIAHSRIKLELAKIILASQEQEIFEQLKTQKRKIEYLASRFAAKEAIIKATNYKGHLQKIIILNDDDGKPYSNFDNVLLTISHDEDYSVAFAISLKKGE